MKKMSSRITLSLSLMSFLCLAICRIYYAEPQRTWKVVNTTCDDESQKDYQCESLEMAADEAGKLKNTSIKIDIIIPQLQLNTSLNFTNLSSLTISGEPGSTNITCTASDSDSAGIVLRDIMGTVTLNNLNFTFCGSQVTYTDRDHDDTYSSALTIIHCNNVELNRVIITRSRGLGLMILDHHGGRVNFRLSSFIGNKLPPEYMNSSEPVMGGGGVYIQLDTFLSSQHSLDPTTFHFDTCTFANNTAHSEHYKYLLSDIILASGAHAEGYGQGGGVYVLLKGGFNNVNVSFVGCSFTGNQAFLGGGLAVKMLEGKSRLKTENITVAVEVRDSVFEHNGCIESYTGFGGGVHLTLNTYFTDSHYIIKDVQFFNNCAVHGGGVYYYSSRQVYSDTLKSNSVLFDNCTFKRNNAHMGSAAIMAPSTFFRMSTGHLVGPTFQNCQFLNNLVNVYRQQSPESQRFHGVGTIYASSYDIRFLRYNCFKNNLGSALYIVNGIANFQKSNASFINNTGLQGGAVALIGSSTMIVGPNRYKFISNKATFQGGALYVLLIDKIDFSASRRCFLQYMNDEDIVLSSDWNSTITFVGNRAASGHAIYATSLYPCQVIDNGTASRSDYTLVNISEVFTSRGENITFDDDAELQCSQLATDGALLKSRLSDFTPLMIIPGEKHCHGVTTTDDLGNQVNAELRMEVKWNHSKKIPDPTSVGSKIQLKGKPGNSGIITLQTMFPRESYIKLKVNLTNCPPGYVLSDGSECICNMEAYMGLFKCDDSFHSYLIPGFWAGLIETPSGHELKLATSAFPFYNSSASVDNTLPSTYDKSELSAAVCGARRTGIACGECHGNFTVHFNSPDLLCKPAEPYGCKFGWLFYILSDLVPVTVVFIMVLVLNISFTSGDVNGFILFSQLLLSLDIYASGIIVTRVKHAAQGFQVIYGFFNLDFFDAESLSFCLWNNASALDIYAIKYITILYTLLLIVAVTLTMNKCGGRWLGKYCRITTIKSSVIHGISTFLVICYAQCVEVSLGLLIPLYLHMEENSKYMPHPRVWFNGELLYFSEKHLQYALPAILCLLTIGLLPPVLLMTYPILNKILATLGLENQRTVKIISQKIPMSSLKPLLDSFQGCFKDNLRFFAGLYFLYRWTFLLTYIYVKHFSLYYTIINTILLFILTLHTICQPYIKRMHNMIDTLLLVNLALINSLSFYNYHKSISQIKKHSDTTSPAVVQLVLIYLPVVVISVYFLAVFSKYIIKRGCKLLIVTNPKRANIVKLRELVQTISSQTDENSDSTEEELTHDRLMDEDIEYIEGTVLEDRDFNMY